MKNNKTNKTLRFAKYMIGIAIIFTLVLGMISASAANEITMQFDDYMDIKGKTVEILDAGTPTSFKVGYGIAANTPDDAVVTQNGDYLVATGIGTAKVKIDGVEQTITVKPAPISVLLLAGQSNMRGSEGKAAQSIVCPTGQVYSTYGVPEDMTPKNAANFAASALTGEKSEINVNGTKSYLSSNPIYALVDKGNGKLGADSGIGYEWALQTNEKVWIINAAHGGSQIESWNLENTTSSYGDNYTEAKNLLDACMSTLQKEIAAGHFTFSHMGYLWCQGETSVNANKDAAYYIEQFTKMHDLFTSTMTYDLDSDPSTPDSTFEFAGNIQVRKGSENSGTYRKGEYPESYVEAGKNIAHYESFYDLRMSGPRVAQYYMANSPDFPYFWNVCTVQEEWVVFPDGTSGVADYFKAHYPDGRVDYQTQSEVSETWRKPTTPKDVHDSIHYNQIGYNELGRESARNILYNLGMVTPPETEVTVKFVCWDGFTPVTTMEANTVTKSSTLVVPIVSPAYKSKEVTYKIEGNFTYDLYDLVADSCVSVGSLTAVGAKCTPVVIPPRALTSYSWEVNNGTFVSTGKTENKITTISGTHKNGQFSKAICELENKMFFAHGESWTLEWKMSGKWTGTGSAGAKRFMAEQNQAVDKNGMALVLFGKTSSIAFCANTGTATYQYGICLSDHGIKFEDSHVYKLENKVNADGSNMIYLFVDGKEIGPMNNEIKADGSDTGKDSDWLNGKEMQFQFLGTKSYELNYGNIDYIKMTEHYHEYKETVVAPTCTEKGYTLYSCSCTDSYTENETAATGHTYTDVVTAPTCTEKGYTTHTCACGDTYTDAEVVATGHAYDNDSDADCNTCGETRTVETTPETKPDGGDNTDKKGGCGSAKSSGLALVSLLLCAQVGVFFKKRRF